MRRHLLVLLFIGLFSSAAARDRYPINDRWEFFFGYRISSDLANYVSLPHTWNADAGAASPDYLRGTGNYLKNINIPLGMERPAAYLSASRRLDRYRPVGQRPICRFAPRLPLPPSHSK